MIKKTTIILAMFIATTQLFAQKKIKLDGVAVVVGENIVLESDVEKFKQEVQQKSEGKIDLSDCEMLEQIMIQKLLAHHAVVDSVIVSDAEVEAGAERNIAYFKQQMGTMEKVVEMYGFDDEDDLRKELIRIERENSLIRQEKQNVLDEVAVTPEEVRVYFKSLEKEGNLPEFGTEVELAQVVMNVKPSMEENKQAIEKLNKIREDVINGASLRMKAILYSEDPGVTQNGGKYTITRESQFVKEFKEVAFSLDEGEISEPFKSDFGYHVIQLDKIKGQELDVRHVLIQPKVSQERLDKAKEKITKVRDSILAGELTFDTAVLKYSEDKETRQNKGILINPNSNDSRFELTRMDPAFYGRVSALKSGDVSEPYFDETREGEKMYKIILMKDKVDSHKADFVKDYVKIQQLTMQKKQEEVLDKWNKEHVSETYVKINETHKSCDFKYNWSKS
jgi:peptidyl-prolyl cis-trans isomerase SurA